MLVSFDNSINAVDFGVEDITIERKAVVSLVGVRWDSRAKAENWNHFVTIIVLQDISN